LLDLLLLDQCGPVFGHGDEVREQAPAGVFLLADLAHHRRDLGRGGELAAGAGGARVPAQDSESIASLRPCAERPREFLVQVHPVANSSSFVLFVVVVAAFLAAAASGLRGAGLYNLREAPTRRSMIRELDDVSLTFSLWQQARQDLHAIEEELLAARRRAMVSSQDLDELDQKMAQTKAKVESLLAQALQALRNYTARGNTGV
jgi:hypothetical protein